MPTATTSAIADTAAKLAAIPQWQEQNRGIIGRLREMHGFTVALAARLHVVYYGAPGVAKSMSVDGVMKHIDLSKFKTQAYKASPPEQFLGPVSMKGLTEDRFARITTGKIPDREVAVIDELGRSPRAVLPAMQGMMVEREFDAGDGVQPVPLMTLVGTTNHLLEDDTELAAFFDRFALKYIVKPPQSQDEFVRILECGRARRLSDPAPPPELVIGRDELTAFQDAVLHIEVPRDVILTVGELWANLMAVGVEPSIRRYDDIIVGMQAQALIDGRDEVLIDDVQLLQHSLWTAPSEAPTVAKEVLRFASEWAKDSAKLIDAFRDIVERLGQVQALTASGSRGLDSVEVTVDGEAKSASLNDHAIQVSNESKQLAEQIQRHVDEAAGRDTSELDAVLTQMDAGRRWVSEKILGGLVI